MSITRLTCPPGRRTDGIVLQALSCIAPTGRLIVHPETAWL